MRIAVTQPYLFPYIAWYQVIDACDTFVIGDDFQYFKSGYINRNQILLGGRPSPFVVEPKTLVAGVPAVVKKRLGG